MKSIVTASILAVTAALAGQVFAQDSKMPTMTQCEQGWKEGMQWTKADFDKACTKMMKK